MIAVVTGPSGAGKTTWIRRHHPGAMVDEYRPTGAGPHGADPAAQAAFWCEVNCDRWAEAIRRERTGGLAVCDDDPLKLHYCWSLARIGAVGRASWAHELAASRAAVAAGRLGLADVVLVSIPDGAQLRRRRAADPTRRRRNFALHARLAEPLREWYQALERIDPGRVVWELPADGLPAVLPAPRADRCDPALFDALIGALPALSPGDRGDGR